MNALAGNKAVFALLVAVFIMTSTAGVFAVETEMVGGAAAYNCPYMGAPVLCAMNPLQHLSEWQHTFATVVQQTATNTLLLLALCVALLFSIRTRLREPSAVRGYLYRSPPSLLPQSKKIIRWLSLFENSPSQI